MIKHYIATSFLLFFLGNLVGNAQVTYTSNDINPPYTGEFRPGINLGYLPPWNTYQLGDLSAGNPALGIPGVGARSTRPGLFDNVLDIYGYGLNVDVFDYYRDLGLEELTAIVGFPSDRHRDWANRYCSDPDKWNTLFKGIYEPIWDDGTDGTPYNEDNEYAAYLYEIVSLYTDNVRFWEIWNEPGLYKGTDSQVFWGDADYPGSWWVNDPDPCDYSIHAPIEHFIRTLRISYEIIKYISPDDYVTIAGVGSQSFLDALLRNSDNPNGGSITPEYPNLGGAYIDVLGFHTYPHLDGSTLFPPQGHFARHSDGAADGIIQRRLGGYQQVLYNYGYDGVTYPKKQHICTEVNVPRQLFTGDYFGGNQAQINFIGKALIALKINNVHQMHVYSISDKVEQQNAGFEFDLMGLYKKLEGIQPYNQELNDEGIAYKTAADLIYPTTYDEAATQALNAPNGVKAYAFAKPDGSFVYAMWAETLIDRSEQASASYSFPSSLNLSTLTQYTWDHSSTGATTTIALTNIQLSATPIFLVSGGGNTNNTAPQPTLSTASTSVSGPFDVSINWSEDVTGFSIADISIVNGSVMSLTGTNTSYTARITATTPGDVIINIGAGVAADLLGLPNLPSNVLTVTSSTGNGTGGSTDADVELVMTASATSVPQFENVTFTLIARNTGQRIAENLIVEFPAPDMMSFVESNVTQGDYTSWTANWNVGSLAAGQSARLEVTFFLLTAEARTAYAQVIAMRQFDIDSTPGNGACCVANEDDEAALTINGSAPPLQLADLSLSITSPQSAVSVDGSFDIEVRISNDGPNATSGVKVRIDIPSGLTITGTNIPATTQLTGSVWSVNRLNLGESRVLRLSFLATDPSEDVVISSEITASTTQDPDSTPNNNQPGEDDRGILVIDGATIVALADLELTLTADRDKFRQLDDINFLLTVKNTGGTMVNNTVIHCPIPVGTSYATNSTTSGYYQRRFGLYKVSQLAPGDSATLSLTVRATRNGPAITTFAQVLSADAQDSDSSPNNRVCCTPIEDDEAVARVNSYTLDLPPNGSGGVFGIAEIPEIPTFFNVHALETKLGQEGYTLSFTTQLEATNGMLVDALGRVVRTQVLATGKGSFRTPINTDNLSPGTYTLLVDTPTGIERVRLVLMR